MCPRRMDHEVPFANQSVQQTRYIADQHGLRRSRIPGGQVGHEVVNAPRPGQQVRNLGCRAVHEEEECVSASSISVTPSFSFLKRACATSSWSSTPSAGRQLPDRIRSGSSERHSQPPVIFAPESRVGKPRTDISRISRSSPSVRFCSASHNAGWQSASRSRTSGAPISGRPSAPSGLRAACPVRFGR